MAVRVLLHCARTATVLSIMGLSEWYEQLAERSGLVVVDCTVGVSGIINIINIFAGNEVDWMTDCSSNITMGLADCVITFNCKQ